MTGALIQLSPRGKAIYQLLSLIVALLPFYAAGFVATALHQLPNQPLVGPFEPSLIERIDGRVFQLLILSGLVSAGIKIAGDGISVRSVIWLRRLWTALVIASVVASPFENGAALDLAAAIALLSLLAASYRAGGSSVYLRLWQVGLLLIVVSLVAAQMLDGRALAALRAFRLQVAYPIAGLSVMFWLMRPLQPGRSGLGGRQPAHCRAACLPGRRADQPGPPRAARARQPRRDAADPALLRHPRRAQLPRPEQPKRECLARAALDRHGDAILAGRWRLPRRAEHPAGDP